jgi:hypothetical protein
MAAEWGNCVSQTASAQPVIYLHCIIKSLSLSLTHIHYQMDLVGHSIWLDQPDGAKTDLQTARFFELQWVVQIQYYKTMILDIEQ